MTFCFELDASELKRPTNNTFTVSGLNRISFSDVGAIATVPISISTGWNFMPGSLISINNFNYIVEADGRLMPAT